MTMAHNAGILLIEPSSLSGGIIVSTARQLNLRSVNLVSSVRVARQKFDFEDFSGVILSLEEDNEALLLLENLRAAQFAAVNPQVPIVVIASSVTSALALKMKTLDVRRVLLKPFKVRDVITTIQRLQETT